MELTAERENFVKLSHIIVDIVANHLRELFRQKWDGKLKQWRNDGNSEDELCKIFGGPFMDGNKGYKEMLKTGDVQQWDTTILCKIFLFSKLKFDKDSPEFTEINKIREIRNNYFAHLKSMSCSGDQFETTVAKVKCALKNLFGVATERKISDIEKSPITQKAADQSNIGKSLLIIFLFYSCI